MKRITDLELKELPLGSVIKVVWSSPDNHTPSEEYCGVVFADKIGYEDGKVDNINTIAEAVYNNFCMVYLM